MAAKARAIMPIGGRMSRAPIANKLKFGYAQKIFTDFFALRKTYVYIFFERGAAAVQTDIVCLQRSIFVWTAAVVRWHDGVHPDFSRVCILSKCQKRRSNRGPQSEKLPPYQIDSALFRERGNLERNGALTLWSWGEYKPPNPPRIKNFPGVDWVSSKKRFIVVWSFFGRPPAQNQTVF